MDSINGSILEEFSAAALDDRLHEVCGLVIKPTGTDDQKLVMCRNSHATPDTDFRIDGEEYADAEDAGQVICVLHSHPGDGARPIFSDTDIQYCNFSGVMWGLVATETGEWSFTMPQNQPLIGRPFILGDTDCYGLVMAWHEKQGIKLDDFRVDYHWWETGENLYMDNYEKAGFVECEPQPGCMVIMQIRSPVPNHAGIITEDGSLLHHMYGKKSEVVSFSRGYFRDRVVKCVKHKDLTGEIKEWRN